MKLKNRKTGKIVELEVHHIAGKCYESLADVNNDWEDYEEPKDFQYIMADGGIDSQPDNNSIFSNGLKEIGNYFKTAEEAEKAVEKLKAWKRLKDAGFKFKGWQTNDDIIEFEIDGVEITPYFVPMKIAKDMSVLFGGEEQWTN